MTNAIPQILDDLTLMAPPEWWERPLSWFLILALALVLAGMVRWWLNRPAPVPPPAPTVPDPLAGETALKELEDLRRRQPGLGAYRLGIEVSDILRKYLAGHHSLPVLFQTTREFLGSVAGNPSVSGEQRGVLGRFLGFCDDVKFARGEAEHREQVELIDTAEAVVRAGMRPASGSVPEGGPR